MSSPGRLTGASLALAAVLLVAASPAVAKVTFSGIGEIRLNMPESAVTDRLGQPSSTEPYRTPQAVRLTYRRQKLTVIVDRNENRVVSITSTARGERTSSGLGVGSREKVVRAKLRGEKCSTALGTLVCSVERAGRHMDFELRRGKVFRVGVGVLG